MLRPVVVALLAACGTSSSAPNFTGNWMLAVDTTGPTGPVALTFTQTGANLDGDGTVASDACLVPRTDATATGTYANGQLVLTVTLANTDGAHSIFHFNATATTTSDPIHGTITGNFSCSDLGDAPATLTPQ